MKKILLCLIGIYCFTQSKAQNFTIGIYDTLHSQILGEDRIVIVHVPTHAEGSSARYPVMYLLDGPNHFAKTIGILDHLSNTAGNELCPQMIVVGIIHPNRERDLIPPANPMDSNQKDLFPQFLEKELIPFINQHYPTEPYRVFAGHSLGGLRVVHTLLYQPELFHSYLALDPSLGMVKNWIGPANEQMNRQNYRARSLYVAMGLTMPKGMDTSVIFRDTSGNARHMRCIMSFSRNVDEKKSSGLEFHWKYYPEETHQSVFFKGMYEGIIQNFYWFKNEKLFDIFKPDVSAEASVRIISDYYVNLSKRMGYPKIAPEEGIADLINYLMFKRWHDKAIAFARFNQRNYPSSDRATRQLEDAIWNSKKSIATLYPGKSAEEILRIIKKDKLKNVLEFNLSEEAINTFAYQLLQQDKYSEACLFFQQNVDWYPQSANAYDSLGDGLWMADRIDLAVKAYKKSLELDPNNIHAKSRIQSAATK